MSEQYRVNVYEDNLKERVIARVRYNANLDFWNGSTWSCGSTGHHKGLTKLRDGRYVLIHGTEWEGEKDWAVVISPEEALQEILRSQNLELLKLKKFAELKELYDQMMIEEDDSEELIDEA